jgi:thioredoxin reductase
MLPATETPVGAMLPAAGPIIAAANATKNVVRMTAGRFQTLEEADQLIREGTADMVAIVRAMIADPDVMSKTLAGRADEIRPCIGCNQGCVGGILGPAGQIGCTVNPTVGFEQTLHEDLIIRTDQSKKVVVVGGGPAGMEAARLAALSGHRVILFEASSQLGGAINLAKRAPNLRSLGDINLWLEREIYRLGVDVRISTYAEREDILAQAPDAVIIATGSAPRMDGIQADTPALPALGMEQSHVHSSQDIFDVPVSQLGKSAVVYDDTGHYEAIGVAEYLISRGLGVTFITRLPMMSPTIARTTRLEPALRRLNEGDFEFIPRARIVEIGKSEVQYVPLEGKRIKHAPADTVVFISGNQPLTEVHESLTRGQNEPPSFILKLAGDAQSPRDLQFAILEGHMAGRFLV